MLGRSAGRPALPAVSVTRAPIGRVRCRAQQLLDLRRDDVVAAGAVVEDAELVLHFARAVDRDRDADVVLGEELDDLRLAAASRSS